MAEDSSDLPSLIGAHYLELADTRAPGLVEGLYLQGSIALGDYRPGRSDVDFVAVIGEGRDPGPLRRIHAELKARYAKPHFDGLYVTWDDLRRDPAHTPARPHVRAHSFEAESREERHLVTWQVLAQGGVVVRGPAVAELGIHTDWDALAAATRENLAGYWTRWVARSTPPLSLWGLSALAGFRVTWGALGVTRLRHTLAAGEVTSKTAAAAYALTAYDERWHRLVREALRLRVGGPPLYRDPVRRRADLLGYMRSVLAG
ncbi:nucleotidyltransferase domain-containing protein [Rhizohabitans arisaemae]|uniref:nucleotidyltransferase domain-containing protein n=1 Tax=Rhizohabitans arisaemae TaxID=2720610 RepID=UPI0024B214A6|nr:nucleotidyltransferase domain-containing protein [Rhizohabitans arisaemae]